MSSAGLNRAAAIVVCAGFALISCSLPGSSAAGQNTQTDRSGPSPSASPRIRVEFVTPTPPTDYVTPTPDPNPPDVAFRLVFQPGSQARYRAREMVLGRSYMTDAIGATSQLQGTILVGPNGSLIPTGSKVTVGLDSLKSDEPQRDEFIKANTLETSRFPEASFIPRSAEGLPTRLNDSSPVSFRLNGDLTIHGVTRATTWTVAGTVEGSKLTGTATTSITFDDFGMTPPKVPLILGVDDTLRLELSFSALRETT